LFLLFQCGKGLQQIKSLPQNYLWVSKKQTTHNKVKWKDYYVKKRCGGLALIDLKKGLVAFLIK
jgi:hypothetical protein